MRNFKDLSRALASIAGGLKGIKDIIDTIEPGGGGTGGLDYSTEEQDTGLKWIDGSAIYQKTLEIDSLVAETDIPHGISNYKQTIKADAVLTRDAAAKSYYIAPGKDCSIFVKETSIFFGGSLGNYTGKPAWATIYYIKTSE